MSLYQKYNHIIESKTLSGLWEYDYTTNVMTWSDYVYVIFGCSKDYVPSLEENTRFFSTDCIKRLTQSIYFLEEYKSNFTGVYDICDTSGEERKIEIFMTGDFDNDVITKRYGIIRDITKQHHQNVESEFLKQRIALALNTSATGTWDYHVENQILYWDDSMLSIFDLSPQQKVSRFEHWIDLIHPSDRNDFITAFNRGSRGLAENNAILITCRTLSPLGRISYVRINAKFYMDENKRNLRILGTCIDTTESEISQKEIVNQATKAQENMIIAQDASASRTRFLANMSHEIRTPMNAIMGALQILESYDLDTGSLNLVNMALDSSDHLLKIINDILDLSKIDAHQMAIESIGINLQQLLSSAIDKFILSLDKDIEINLTIPPEFNPYRVGDPVRFNQIINNLISNAIKFTEKGSVDICLLGNDESIELSVKDTGIGIPKHQLQNIFSPFKQADDSITRSYGGTGLGLAICTSLTELMSGKLKVTSEEGVGTEFIFQAPMLITVAPTVNESLEVQIEPPDLTGLNIIIAEDNESNQTILKHILANKNNNIQICDNGKQALETYHQMHDVDYPVNDSPSHIVAIGASAGGLEALEILFDALPDDLGCSYVVVQHLSPDFKSMMDELLKKHTNMPTHQATEGETLLANTVYLIPAGKLMRVTDGKIYLSELPPDNRINLPINEFFRTLAEDSQNKAVGIILSGTGSDGCRGIQAMKEAGAMVISQDPEEAQFNGMPQNAINTGSVDFVLKVAEMPGYIKNFISHPLTATTTDQFKFHLSQNTGLLEQILKLIQKQTDLDFKAYKESTVSRRIEHRMSINNKLSLQEYWEYLQENENEIELVKQDLLIGVTQFFRDPELWEKLRVEVIKPLVLEATPKDPIRVWTTGCSTGEEAYTIAMLFDSTIKELGLERQVKVFASDIDQTAVAYAANGIYPTGISNEVPSNYLSNYFYTLADGNYQVTKELRSLVVLATHNVIQDPPFSNMDLVSCRNCLIYLQTPAQQKALAFFHFALKKNGYMVLGSAESPGNFSNYFHTIDSKLRIYQKTQDLRIPVSSITSQGIRRGGYEPKTIPQYIERINKRTVKPRNRLIGIKTLQERFLPPTFIIDSKLQLIYSYGDTSFLTTKLKAGEVTNDIADILVPELTSHVLSAAHQVIRENNGILMESVFNQTDTNGELKSYSLNCFSFNEEDEAEKYIAISFVENASSKVLTGDLVYTPEEQTQQRILELDSSLVECQRMYREALEDLDTTSEELQSSNEELMAANEELQSTNEELQSVNEELYTVNSEYQQKIVELTDTNNDLENLLTATELAVLFLDSELRIRRYTRPLTNFLNIMDFDLNRPFMDLSLKFDFDGLHQLIHSVNDGGGPVHEVIDISEESQIEISISPYTIGKDNNGVVVSMRELK